MSLAFLQISTWAPDFIAAIHAHYTGSDGPPYGKKLAWRIHEHGRLIGHIGIGEPTFKLAPRRRLGLADARQLEHAVNCFIFRALPERVTPAHQILRQWHLVAAREWEQRYGWLPVHWETMVGQRAADNPGACFKRAGYRRLGLTTGRSARRPAGHGSGPRVWMDSTPKIVLYRGPLARLPELHRA